VIASIAILLAGGVAPAMAEEVTPPASSVTASTSDTNVAGNAVDNNLTTRWSGNGDGAWIQFDLGTDRLVESVSIAVYNGNGRRNQFDLQTSTGGGVWTTVHRVPACGIQWVPPPSCRQRDPGAGRGRYHAASAAPGRCAHSPTPAAVRH
jgi:hypothetical protein